jgi:hypothetical protein
MVRVGMAEPLGDDLDLNAAGQQQRGVRVPEVVQPDAR